MDSPTEITPQPEATIAEPVLFKPGKSAIVSEQELGVFALEYDNTLGKKHSMRLDATTYEKALREARSYLGIDENGYDEAGDPWVVE